MWAIDGDHGEKGRERHGSHGGEAEPTAHAGDEQQRGAADERGR
jgi:hypothetical protein